ncbi:bifunctional epoxide hydrolase 2-like [Zingiber officinale]|uniref:bifunctional epoxide hydrolase 2-like n=1 Tax=Zingiber officinale TaxID=94328 RepID=UPI001C4B6EDF|nr:bifunctional epoxide hydrolase 2-like [Zingiber officinale]
MLRFARGLCSCLCCRSRVLAVAAPSAPNNGRLGEGITHRTVFMNDINMHVSEKGDEPVVLLLHGFPELWYTWRHQMHRLAALRYRTVAPDLRGFGDTEAPAEYNNYSIFHIVGDLIELIDNLVSAHHVFVVGHDWGSMVAWNLSMFRPDKVRAMVNLSQAFTPRNPTRKSLEHLRSAFGDDYYICRFQVSIRRFNIDKFLVHALLFNIAKLLFTPIHSSFNVAKSVPRA